MSWKWLSCKCQTQGTKTGGEVRREPHVLKRPIDQHQGEWQGAMLGGDLWDPLWAV